MPNPLTHPITQKSAAIGVTGYANILRKIEPEPAGSTLVQVLESLQKAVNTLYSAAAVLSDFEQDQLGVLIIDALNINHAKSRFRYYDPAPITYISAVGNTIYPTGSWMRLKNTTGGSLTLSSTPTVAPGKDGQTLTLINIGTQSIVLQDQSTTLANSNLRLLTNTVTLARFDRLSMEYSADLAGWLQGK